MKKQIIILQGFVSSRVMKKMWLRYREVFHTIFFQKAILHRQDLFLFLKLPSAILFQRNESNSHNKKRIVVNVVVIGLETPINYIFLIFLFLFFFFFLASLYWLCKLFYETCFCIVSHRKSIKSNRNCLVIVVQMASLYTTFSHIYTAIWMYEITFAGFVINIRYYPESRSRLAGKVLKERGINFF